MGVVPITPGTGADVATDLIASRHHQQIKIGVGEDGTATPVSAANPMPVQEIATADSVLERILQMLQGPRGYDASQARQRITAVIESGVVTTVASVTNLATCATLTSATNLVNLGGIPADVLTRAQINSAWASIHRARIT